MATVRQADLKESQEIYQNEWRVTDVFEKLYTLNVEALTQRYKSLFLSSKGKNALVAFNQYLEMSEKLDEFRNYKSVLSVEFGKLDPPKEEEKQAEKSK